MRLIDKFREIYEKETGVNLAHPRRKTEKVPTTNVRPGWENLYETLTGKQAEPSQPKPSNP